ncbi:MAG: urease accessory protein UreE [Eubacterium sp.]|nr:urease accessory protein UreE [Eubacterium sp.]
MVIEEIIGNINDEEFEIKSKNKNVVNVEFEWFELEKKRIRKTASNGTELGISIDGELHGGDVIAETDTEIYVVKSMPAHLIKITVNTMEEMGRLGFELGNRHLSLQISSSGIKVPYDEPTYLYLKKLGFNAEEVTEDFDDFIQCKAHGEGNHHAGHSHAEHLGGEGEGNHEHSNPKNDTSV